MSMELLTSADLMALLKISEATLWRKVKSGLIPAPESICGLKRWRAGEIAALISPISAPGAKPIPRNRVRAAA